MKMDGVLDELYHEGAPDIQFFMDWCSNPANTVYGVFVPTENETAEIVGMGFLNQLREMGGNLKKGEIGFSFLPRSGAGMPISAFTKIAAGKQILYRFFSTFPVDYVFGTTPVHNRLAIRYAEYIGMRRPSIVDNFTTYKGQVCGVSISQCSKEEFMNKYEAENPAEAA